MNKSILAGALIALILTFVGTIVALFASSPQIISDYQGCKESGGLVRLTYPAVCVSQDGRTFEEPLPSPLPTNGLNY